jgi:hypothetical protein
MVLRFVSCAIVLAALLAAAPAAAQVRVPPIPAEAQRGVIRHLKEMAVAIDNRPVQLAPGAQIRNQQNLIVVPVALPPSGTPADYILNADGELFRAWLLTPQELAQPRSARGGR